MFGGFKMKGDILDNESLSIANPFFHAMFEKKNKLK